MIKIKNICKTFKNLNKKKEVLRNVSFEITEGEITGFLGVNGSGKTTLIKIILQFISHNSGQIQYMSNISNSKGAYHSIGYLPERPYYYTNLTGYEFLKFTVSLSVPWTSKVESKCFEYAETLNVRDALNRNLRDYSKGMLQKVGFISNLVSECKLLILDEPLSGLDLISREEYKKVLIDYAKSGGSVFISSHIVSDLEQMADRIVLLDSGEIKYEGESKDFFREFDTDELEIVTQDGTEVIRDNELGRYLQNLSEVNKSESLRSIKRERKSFKQYINEVRNEK